MPMQKLNTLQYNYSSQQITSYFIPNIAVDEMPPSRSNRSRSEPSQTRERSSGKSSSESPEILHQLGRAVLAYSMKRMSGQDTSTSTSGSRSAGRHDRDSSRRSRSSPGQKDRGTDRTSSHEPDTARGDSSDLHHIMGQVAVGLVGYGVRQYLHQRKKSKQQAATARQPGQSRQKEGTSRGWPGVGAWSKDSSTNTNGNRSADPELAAALESLSGELESTSRAIRRLTNNPPCHKSCEVHHRLKANADGLQGSIADIRTSVNNIKNLHGGLEKKRDACESAGGERGRQKGGGGSSSSTSGRRTREEGGSRRKDVEEGKHARFSRTNRGDRDGRR